MSDHGRDEKFLNPGTCPVPSCEVVLVLEDKSRLYACKHRLANISKFFLPLFHGDFKEKHMEEIEINDVSEADLLLFLRCTAEPISTEVMAIPSDGPSLSTLISLADEFMCQLLKDRILSHLSTDAMFEASLATKQAIIETAHLHRDGCFEILEACVRLCATLEMTEIAQLHDKIGGSTVAAIYALKSRALLKTLGKTAECCDNCGQKVIWDGNRSGGSGWYCSNELCNRCCVNYKEFKTFKVDRDLITK